MTKILSKCNSSKQESPVKAVMFRKTKAKGILPVVRTFKEEEKKRVLMIPYLS
jgi:hypothetical protein